MIQAGSKLTHYKVISALGKGGMGEVWRARDSKLGREVAIKTLPDEFSKDEERLARFRREAQLLASLNHPNIATIHGLEEDKDKRFLVLELVEGDTLAERLQRGAIPVEESLDVALQIAEALEAAHEKGVIHRDLKPANIKVTPAGKVKVLDFGLAKAFEGDGPGTNLSNSPTLSVAATNEGIILGTAAYMSPEQAKGAVVDKRADIFSFGCVLFEMLAGRRTFQGEVVSEILASVLAREPDWKQLPPDIHPRVRDLLERCLEKQPKKRFRDIGDVRIEIEKASAAPRATEEARGTVLGRRYHAAWAAGLVVATIATGFAVAAFMRPEPGNVTRFSLLLPGEQQLVSSSRTSIAMSPDGRRLVYATTSGLYIREMNELTPIPIRGAEEGSAPLAFSPDGESVVYMGRGPVLQKIAATGGPPVTLTEPPDGIVQGVSWEEDGTILFSNRAGIWRVSENGGTPQLLAARPDNAGVYSGSLLPDGRSLLLTSGVLPETEIIVHSLETGESTVVIDRGTDARYSPTGHIVYAVDESLMAVSFDLDELTVSGGPTPVVEQVSGTAARQFDFSPDGTLVYFPDVSTTDRNLTWVNRDGSTEALGLEGDYNAPRLSTDGERLAVILDDDLWIRDLDRGSMTRITRDGASRPVWTPDGDRIAFTSEDAKIYWAAADGNDEPELLVESEHSVHSNAWSGDGRYLLFHEHHPETGADTWTFDIENLAARAVVATELTEDGPVFSPDGEWVAFNSSESGRQEIYAMRIDGQGRRVQVSTDGGYRPVWGKNWEIFYLAGLQNAQPLMMTVSSAANDDELEVGNPEMLFEGPIVGGSGPFAGYDVTPDGERFIMTFANRAATTPYVVVLNWFEELKEKVPLP